MIVYGILYHRLIRLSNLFSITPLAVYIPQAKAWGFDGRALRGSSCEVCSSDMRVKTKSTGSYFYPDVVVVCDKLRFEDNVFDTLLNPIIIVEVLSPSTEVFDRGEKFAQYQELVSLREYILVSQDRMCVEQHRLIEIQWVGKTFEAPENVLKFNAIECTLPLRNIYTHVSFSD